MGSCNWQFPGSLNGTAVSYHMAYNVSIFIKPYFARWRRMKVTEGCSSENRN